jgi:hypothetical protein
MPRPTHRADAAAEARIASAVAFAAHFRKGPLETYRVEAASLADARAAADRLNAEHGKNGRRAMVYAITREGVAIPVPAAYPA